MKAKILCIFSLLTCLCSASTHPHPFAGVPLTQSVVETTEGQLYVRLHRANSSISSLRAIEEDSADAEEEVLFLKSWGQRLWEMVVGKSPESIADDLYFATVKQRTSYSDERYLTNFNDWNLLYFMDLQVGSQGQSLPFLFDTGSSWLSVNSWDCPSCGGQFLFNHSASASFHRDFPYFYLSYGQESLAGSFVQDQVWIASKFGVRKFPFFLVKRREFGGWPMAGVLGFARAMQGIDYAHPGPLYYEYLSQGGSSPNQLFALYYADAEYSSFVQFGDFDRRHEYVVSDIFWLDLVDDYYWTVTTAAVRTSTFYEEFQDFTYAILDTGTSLLYVPASPGKSLQRSIASGKRGFKLFGEWHLKCDQGLFPSVFIELGGYWFELPPQAYLFDFRGQEGAAKDWCVLGIRLAKGEQWVLGAVFLRNYYSVWSREAWVVGLAIRTGSYVGITPYASNI